MERAAREVLAATTFLVAYDGRRPALAAKVEVGAAVGASENALAEAARSRRITGRYMFAPCEPEKCRTVQLGSLPDTAPSSGDWVI